MIYILFNPLANNKKGDAAVNEVKALYNGKECKEVDVCSVKMNEFTAGLAADDVIVLCGGDGTVNHFVNDVYDNQPAQKVYYYPSGSGNDFAHDVENCEKYLGKLIPLNEFYKNLPVVEVKDIKKRFINGIGFGIDGYCCEVGDEMRKLSDKPVDYAGIAIKGLLGKFHPSNATVTVDGVTKTYKHVWLAPSMVGRYYGGGMNVAPAQNRLNAEKTLSCVVWHKWGKLGTLIRFPSIFKGEHIKYRNMIEIREGHEITVEFDKPQALQIDGETVTNVLKYTVTFGK